MMLEQARAYAEFGWAVFPCHSFRDGLCTCSASDCSSPGKHPAVRGGLKEASRQGLTLDLWWTRQTDANVGVATGSVSDLCVLDIDTDSGPEAALEIAWQLHRDGLLPPTWSARSGSGGLHFYYRLEGAMVRNRTRVRPMVDIRGENGSINAPPSVNAKGAYAWRKRPGARPALVPRWMAEKREKPKHFPHGTRGQRRRNVPGDLPAVSSGGRNDRIFRVGCGLAGAGEPAEYIERFLNEFNDIRCSPPLPEREIRTAIQSVLRYAR